MDSFLGFFTNENALSVYRIVWYTAPVWLPILLGIIAWRMWIVYARSVFFASLKYTLLEIRLPKEVFKSPAAMEFLFNALWQIGGEATWYDRNILGKTRPWFSLEITSQGGALHFYIWTRAGFKNIIEANLYSQYPGVEISEVMDYTLPYAFDPNVTSMWASEFKLSKPDSYPIKTYIDYGLDKDPKEEFKIDPLIPLIEGLGALQSHENAWIQIIIRAHKAEDWDKEKKKMVDKRWAAGAKEEIKKIMDEAKNEDAEGKKTPRILSKGEADVVAALERSIIKYGFDVGIRAIYFAPKENFNGNIGSVIHAGFRNFNTTNLNGFIPDRVPDALAPYPWSDRRKKNRNFAKGLMLAAYKHRGYFYNEFAQPYFVLNTEELSTIFHIPGGVLSTPSVDRVESKKSEAPSNLPI